MPSFVFWLCHGETPRAFSDADGAILPVHTVIVWPFPLSAIMMTVTALVVQLFLLNRYVSDPLSSAVASNS